MTKPYSISLNGRELFETNSNIFSVDVIHGDLISVSSKFACEGKLEKRIILNNNFLVYPNPTSNDIEIVLPEINMKEVSVAVYNIQLQLISNKSYQLDNNKIKISLKDNPSGMYFIKLELDDNSVTFKIIKQ